MSDDAKIIYFCSGCGRELEVYPYQKKVMVDGVDCEMALIDGWEKMKDNPYFKYYTSPPFDELIAICTCGFGLSMPVMPGALNGSELMNRRTLAKAEVAVEYGVPVSVLKTREDIPDGHKMRIKVVPLIPPSKLLIIGSGKRYVYDITDGRLTELEDET